MVAGWSFPLRDSGREEAARLHRLPVRMEQSRTYPFVYYIRITRFHSFFFFLSKSRIVGGTDTGVNEFPMMAGIVDADERSVFCGSTIISVRYVLTAAHCMTNRNYTRLGVLVGDHDLNSGK